jgi:hypothetical protein
MQEGLVKDARGFRGKNAVFRKLPGRELKSCPC